MPIYCYSCADCGLEFDELRSFEKKDDPMSCPDCGAGSKRLEVTGFSFNSGPLDPKRDTLVSPKEIDKAVGAAADKSWQGYNERWKARYEEDRKKRWAGKTPKDINIPKDPDGKYTPIMHLGDKKERAIRKEFTDALKDHRDDRKRKGLSQFGDSSMAADRDRIILKKKTV
jgi:putative FmdB family regulatory protein